MKLLVDGEGFFGTRGTLKHGHPVPTTFTSKIVSNAESSDASLWIAAARRRPRVLNHPAHPCNLIWAARDGWGRGNLTASKKPRVSGDSCRGF